MVILCFQAGFGGCQNLFVFQKLSELCDDVLLALWHAGDNVLESRVMTGFIHSFTLFFATHTKQI